MDSIISSEKNVVAVIGAGSFGSAVANLLAENNPVLLYTRRPGNAAKIRESRISGGQKLHDDIVPTEDLHFLAEHASLIFPIVPSLNFIEMLRKIAPYLRPDHILIHGTKGLFIEDVFEQSEDIELKLGRQHIKTMSELIRQETVVVKVGCLGGPNLAREIAAGKPAASVIASGFDEVINEGKAALRSSRFQVYGSHELIGIELAGVLKNILAIASGMVRGLDLGENTRALLLTKGLSEMIHLGNKMDLDFRAFLGLAGLGDMIATCSSPDSRNYSVGYKIAKGTPVKEVLENMDELAEGVHTLKITQALCNNYGLKSPIINFLYRVLYDGLSVQDNMHRLMYYRSPADVDFV